jgi:hypothetical protein
MGRPDQCGNGSPATGSQRVNTKSRDGASDLGRKPSTGIAQRAKCPNQRVQSIARDHARAETTKVSPTQPVGDRLGENAPRRVVIGQKKNVIMAIRHIWRSAPHKYLSSCWLRLHLAKNAHAAMVVPGGFQVETRKMKWSRLHGRGPQQRRCASRPPGDGRCFSLGAALVVASALVVLLLMRRTISTTAS